MLMALLLWVAAGSILVGILILWFVRVLHEIYLTNDQTWSKLKAWKINPMDRRPL